MIDGVEERGREIDGVEERDLERVREESKTGDNGESTSESIKEREKKEFLGGGIGWNGDSGNQRGIT